MKINLKESLNKIDLATNNKYDLLNTFNSKKLSDNNKKKLAEAIENNSIASINRVLHESEEQLFKVVIQSGATKRNFESALYEDEAEEIVDYYGGRWIDENGFEWNMYVEEDDDSTEHAAIDNSYDMEDDDERSQRECVESLNEDLSSIKEIKQLDFTNNRVNNLRGIFSTKSFVKALNDVGLDKFKIRTSKLKNVSSGDLKDAWYDLKRNGWLMSIERDPSLSGFNEVYVFEKITNESLNEAIDDEIDLDYETDFDDDGVEEGNTFVEGGVEYAWIQREAGPIYLDFDKWAVWSAREYVDPRDFMVIEPDGKEYKFDGDAFKEKAMAAPITYFVVEEDTGFIDWGPEDNEIAAKDFLNGKKEDWENDMSESLNEDKELNEYYTVNLHYEDIGDGREYDYEADYDDVLEYLMEICVDDDNAPEDTQEYIDWVETNFDYLLKKYEYRVLNYFEEDASQEEYDRRHSSYEPEYDPMD